MKEALGRPQLPAFWDFIEKERVGKGDPDIKIVQLEQNFLALRGRLVAAEETNYLFNGQGKVILEKSIRDLSGTSKLYTSDIQVWNEDGELAKSFQLYDNDIKAGNSRVTFDIGYIDRDRHIGFRPFSLATFKNARLTELILTHTFYINTKGYEILSPECQLFIDENGKPKIKPFSGFFYDFSLIRGDSPNEFKIANDKREIVYSLAWELKDGSILFRQTHLPTGIAKTLRAPLEIDLMSLREKVLAKPPYEKIRSRLTGAEDMVLPWRNMDEVLGVNLSYSHLVPQKKV